GLLRAEDTRVRGGYRLLGLRLNGVHGLPGGAQAVLGEAEPSRLARAKDRAGEGEHADVSEVDHGRAATVERAGWPITRAPGGTSRTTTEPIPTTAPAPTRTRLRTRQPILTWARSPTSLHPASTVPAPTSAHGPTRALWPTLTWFITMASSSMRVRPSVPMVTTTPAPRRTPAPSTTRPRNSVSPRIAPG